MGVEAHIRNLSISEVEVQRWGKEFARMKSQEEKKKNPIIQN